MEEEIYRHRNELPHLVSSCHFLNKHIWIVVTPLFKKIVKLTNLFSHSKSILAEVFSIISKTNYLLNSLIIRMGLLYISSWAFGMHRWTLVTWTRMHWRMFWHQMVLMLLLRWWNCWTCSLLLLAWCYFSLMRNTLSHHSGWRCLRPLRQRWWFRVVHGSQRGRGALVKSVC